MTPVAALSLGDAPQGVVEGQRPGAGQHGHAGISRRSAGDDFPDDHARLNTTEIPLRFSGPSIATVGKDIGLPIPDRIEVLFPDLLDGGPKEVYDIKPLTPYGLATSRRPMIDEVVRSCIAFLTISTIALNGHAIDRVTNQPTRTAAPPLHLESPNQLVAGAETGTDYFYGDAGTNGLVCTLRIDNDMSKDPRSSPTCTILVRNASENVFSNCWEIYPLSYFKVELADSRGLPVKKSKIGNEATPSQQEMEELINERYQGWRKGRFRTTGFTRLTSKRERSLASFSIPDSFEVKESGEYTLKVRIRLIQDTSGRAAKPTLRVIWLPEVSARIRIQRTP